MICRIPVRTSIAHFVQKQFWNLVVQGDHLIQFRCERITSLMLELVLDLLLLLFGFLWMVIETVLRGKCIDIHRHTSMLNLLIITR